MAHRPERPRLFDIVSAPPAPAPRARQDPAPARQPAPLHLGPQARPEPGHHARVNPSRPRTARAGTLPHLITFHSSRGRRAAPPGASPWHWFGSAARSTEKWDRPHRFPAPGWRRTDRQTDRNAPRSARHPSPRVSAIEGVPLLDIVNI